MSLIILSCSCIEIHSLEKRQERGSLNIWNSGTCDRGKANRGPRAMPTALRLTKSALAFVLSFRATYMAMYLLLTALAEPTCMHVYFQHKLEGWAWDA